MPGARGVKNNRFLAVSNGHDAIKSKNDLQRKIKYKIKKRHSSQSLISRVLENVQIMTIAN